MTKQTTIIIQHDLFAESPRDPEFSDNFSTLACEHSRYNLGDEDGMDELEAALGTALQAVFERRFKAKTEQGMDVWDEECGDWFNPLFFNDVHEAVSVYEENEHLVPYELRVYIKPLYLYDHGGISLSDTPFSCSWDSGKVGYQFATYSEILSEYGGKRLTERTTDLVERTMNGELQAYSCYIEGEVYGYVIYEHEAGQRPEAGEYIDSCHNFYGSDYTTNGMAQYWPKEYTTYNIIDEHNTELQYAA